MSFKDELRQAVKATDAIAALDKLGIEPVFMPASDFPRVSAALRDAQGHETGHEEKVQAVMTQKPSTRR